MARVFVSHASKDRECAGQLREWLVAERHQVFLDQDPGDGIGLGEEWEQRLDKQLRWADAVVCGSPQLSWHQRGAATRWAMPGHEVAGYCRSGPSRAWCIPC